MPHSTSYKQFTNVNAVSVEQRLEMDIRKNDLTTDERVELLTTIECLEKRSIISTEAANELSKLLV